eukprot:EC832777.1.p4 GENE.EC832777.1~~EC832777.1.p4  ORF type:complete len:51 (-),score=9.10 EC832777.1:67-219(-)
MRQAGLVGEDLHHGRLVVLRSIRPEWLCQVAHIKRVDVLVGACNGEVDAP